MVVRLSLPVLLIACVVLSACGSQPKSAAPSSSQVAAAFTGSPAPLMTLHAQANELLGGGRTAFNARVASLRGYPIVVNKWASWCGPCQTEFPAFQRAAVLYGSKVAFMGLDGKDANQAAASFLKRFPVTYPSYVDPQERIASSIKASTYYPLTVYFDREGQPIYEHAGAYASVGALESDIRRYALG